MTDKLKISGTVGSRPSRFPVSRWGLALVVGAILVVVFKLADWTAELLWFRALGYEEAFWRLRIARIAMFAIAFIPVFAYVRLNLLVLARFADVRSLLGGGSPAGMSQSWPDHSGTGGAPPKTRQLTALQIFASATIATIFGFAFYGEWDRFLRWVWAQDSGMSDPIYLHDANPVRRQVAAYSEDQQGSDPTDGSREDRVRLGLSDRLKFLRRAADRMPRFHFARTLRLRFLAELTRQVNSQQQWYCSICLSRKFPHPQRPPA